MKYNPLQEGSIGNVILIIFGIILSAILVGLITGNNRLLGEFTDKSPLVDSTKNEIKPKCGLTVISPKEGSIITFPLSITGYVNGCGWVAQESIAGVVTVRDSNNIIRATEALIVNGNWMDLPTAFHATVSIPMFTNSGTLNFINIDPSGQNSLAHIVHINH